MIAGEQERPKAVDFQRKSLSLIIMTLTSSLEPREMERSARLLQAESREGRPEESTQEGRARSTASWLLTCKKGGGGQLLSVDHRGKEEGSEEA